MIYKHKIHSLTEDELCVLGFIANQNSHLEYNVDELCWLNPRWLFQELNQQASKIKVEHKCILQSIVDKLNL